MKKKSYYSFYFFNSLFIQGILGREREREREFSSHFQISSGYPWKIQWQTPSFWPSAEKNVPSTLSWKLPTTKSSVKRSIQPGKRILLSVVLYFLIQKEIGIGMLDTSPHRFAYLHSMLRIVNCIFFFPFPFKYLSVIPTNNQEKFVPWYIPSKQLCTTIMNEYNFYIEKWANFIVSRSHCERERERESRLPLHLVSKFSNR